MDAINLSHSKQVAEGTVFMKHTVHSLACQYIPNTVHSSAFQYSSNT